MQDLKRAQVEWNRKQMSNEDLEVMGNTDLKGDSQTQLSACLGP